MKGKREREKEGEREERERERESEGEGNRKGAMEERIRERRGGWEGVARSYFSAALYIGLPSLFPLPIKNEQKRKNQRGPGTRGGSSGLTVASWKSVGSLRGQSDPTILPSYANSFVNSLPNVKLYIYIYPFVFPERESLLE